MSRSSNTHRQESSSAAGDLTTGTCAWAVATILGLVLGAGAAPAQEIARVRMDGGMEIIILDTFYQPLRVALEDRNGAEVASTWLDPALDERTVTLDPQLSGLPTRGLQHRLALTDDMGNLLDELHLRFAFDCWPDGSHCDLGVRTGLQIDQGVTLSPELSSLLRSSEVLGDPLDLAQTASTDPELLGAILEMSTDLASSGLQDAEGCQCFFGVQPPAKGRETHSGAIARTMSGRSSNPTYIKSGFEFDWYIDWAYLSESTFRARHRNDVTAEMSFHCMKTDAVQLLVVSTSGGPLGINVPQLTPCPEPCSAAVGWEIRDYWWQIVQRPTEWAGTEAEFQLEWGLDVGQPLFQDQQADAKLGTYAGPLVSGASEPFPPVFNISEPPPSRSYLSTHSSVQLHDWSQYQLPQATVEAGLTQVATGTASCAATAVMVAEPDLFKEEPDIKQPGKITIVIQPVDE